jgi:flagellar export protein FliJ
MKRQSKDLNTLLRLHDWTIDSIRRELKVIQDQENSLQQEDKLLDQQLTIEQNVTRQNPLLSGHAFSNYYRFYREEKERIAENLKLVQEALDETKSRLFEAYKEQKVLEEVKKNYRMKEVIEEKRQEQNEFDEISLNKFIQKHHVL